VRKEALIAKIIDLEWNMFHMLSNIGGKASCQEDPKTFKIMRYSQAVSWAEDALESYLTDLSEAQKNNRNLLMEKYARMMKSTSPWEYYDRLEKRLPVLEPETLQVIENIVQIVLEWEEELSVEYPSLVKRGRPIHSTEDSQFITSIETYLRGELATYSLTTLEMYYKNILWQKSENINGSEITLNSMVKQYGFNSLAEANKIIKQKS